MGFRQKFPINFLRWVAAFRLRKAEILSRERLGTGNLLELIRKDPSLEDELKGALNLLDAVLDRDIAAPEQWALQLPRNTSDWLDGAIVMFLDEFQHACDPNYYFEIVPLMRHAKESPTCPHFVAVSTFGVLSGELVSPRLLSGQSIRKPLGPMTDYWGAELALRSARYYSADLPEDMAPVVSARCGGNPFYIASVVRRSAKQGKTLADEQTFNEILTIDLSSGFIWEELNEQVESWIKRFDDVGVAKWVLYLSAFEKDEWIKPERIRKKLLQREARDVSVESVRDILIKLSRGDLLDYCEMGGWFRKADDPILVDFLRVWGRIAVENNNPVKVRQELIIEYRSLKREIHHRLGYLGGVCMAQVLSNTRRRTIPARFFHTTEDIAVPFYWVYILHRTKLGATPDIELDVEAAAGMEMWLCESKWWRGRKAGVKEVESLLYKGRLLREKEGPGLEILRLWFFAHDGFTPEAEAMMAEKGVLWSHIGLNVLRFHRRL